MKLEAGSYRSDQVMYGAFCPNDYTLEIFLVEKRMVSNGTSLITPIEDLIYKYLELIEGYTNYIKKYGLDVTLLITVFLVICLLPVIFQW